MIYISMTMLSISFALSIFSVSMLIKVIKEEMGGFIVLWIFSLSISLFAVFQNIYAIYERLNK